MILVILIILIVIFLLGASSFIRNRQDPEDSGGWIAVLAMIGMLIFMIIINCEIGDNARDIATLRKYDDVIAVQQNRISQLSSILEKNLNVKVNNGQLASTDTPYASLIEAYTDATQQLANAQSRKANAAVNIEARKHSIWAFIVNWYGDH